MFRKNKTPAGGEKLSVIKNAGYTATKKVKRDKTVNRRAGLHDKVKNLQGEERVKRRKPLALKHVRRMRKFAAVASVGVVGAVAVVGVGFFAPAKDIQLDGDYETVCFVAPADGTKPTDHTLVENVGYMNYVLKNQPYWSSVGKSTVVANVGVSSTQTVDTYKQYYGNVLISTDIALNSTLASLNYGEQFCQANGVVLTRKSTTNSEEELKKGMNAPWSTGPATGWTLKGFRRNRGLPPLDFSVYVLNELTIANATEYSVVDNQDGTYSMTLNLNVNTGVGETSADYYYRLQMKANGNLYDLPTIFTTTVTYTFDENWRVLTCESSDTNKTTPSLGLTANCSSNAKTVYYYDEDLAKNTFWSDYYGEEYERQKDSLTDDDVIDAGGTDSAFGYLSGAFASVLSEGAVFKLDLDFDKLSLDGVVCVEMGDETGLTARLGDMLVWLDGGTLYLNYGDLEYKLNTDGLFASGESADGDGASGGLDVNALMDQLTGGDFTLDEETGIATLKSELELFGLKISLNFEFLKGNDSISLNFVEADIPVSDKIAHAKLCFGTEDDKPTVPADTENYIDVLNSDLTFDVNLALYSGNIDVETGKREGVSLDGKVALALRKGELSEIRAEFEEFAIYYEFAAKKLYLKVGTTKAMIDVSAMDLSAVPVLGLFADIDLFAGNGSGGVSVDLPKIVNDLLYNLVAETKVISTSADLSVLDAIVPLWAKLDLNGGIGVEAGISLLGIDAEVKVKLSDGTLEGLTEEDKKEYTDVLKEGMKVVENLLGGNIAATVNGQIYSENEQVYGFTASVEYIAGAEIEGGDGETVKGKPYIHINMALEAKRGEDDSLYLDIAVLDANPAAGENGRTAGGYTTDGKLDIYLTVSKYDSKNENYSPAKFYAPVDEIFNVAAMAGAALNLGNVKIENNEVLTSAVHEIAELLDGMLISKYLPKSVQDKFASLGDSLIPQILGFDLSELLNKLLGGVSDGSKSGDRDERGGNVGGAKFLLSDKYVSSITSSEDSLRFVLNSSLIYNKDISVDDSLTVDFVRALKDGVYFVDSVELKNVYFGENASDKINIGLNLDYGNVILPDAATAFGGYVNADGLDSLLNGIINSVTHHKDDATDREKEIFGTQELPDYILNHYYYIDGQISVDLNIIDIVKATVNLDVVALSVTIDEETNEVGVNVRLHYDALTAGAIGAEYIAINGESFVDLTIKGGMLYIKRTQLNYLEKASGLNWGSIVGGLISLGGYKVDAAKSKTPVPYANPVVTYRVYELKSINSDMDSIMDLVSYIFNLNEKIVTIVNDSVKTDESAKIVKTDTSAYDYGALADYYFKSFIYSEDGAGNATWQAKISKAFLTDLIGMEVSDDPTITFSATSKLDVEGKRVYLVDNLSISNTAINFVKVAGKHISMSLNGSLNYRNPQLEMDDGCDDVTSDNSLIWEEVFGCASEGISKSALWNKALQLVGKDYLAIDMSDANSVLKLGKLKFNLAGKLFEEGKHVLYTADGVLSAYTVPEWTKKNGYSIETAFNASTVSVDASYVANNYEIKLDFGDYSVIGEVIGYTYDTDVDISSYIGKNYACGDKTLKVLGFVLDGVTYGADNAVISRNALAEIYCKDINFKVITEEVAGDTATHVTFNSTVSFTYSGYDGLHTLLNVDFEDGAEYSVTDASSEGYMFLGWWYNGGDAWRKVTSVEEFSVEGKPSFVTLEALWIKIDLDGSGSRSGIVGKRSYNITANVQYDIVGNSELVSLINLESCTVKIYINNDANWTGRDNILKSETVSDMKDNKLSISYAGKTDKKDCWNAIVGFTFSCGSETIVIEESESTHISGKF